MGYKKTDVETHHNGYDWSTRHPAVNVKVYGSPGDPQSPKYHGEFEGMTEEWFDAYAEKNSEWLFESACESNREMIVNDAQEIFGSHVKVYYEGRSGGWAIVDGIADIDEWDAIMLSKWRRFERYAKMLAADVPYQMLSIAYINGWEPEMEEARGQAERIQELSGRLML